MFGRYFARGLLSSGYMSGGIYPRGICPDTLCNLSARTMVRLCNLGVFALGVSLVY